MEITYNINTPKNNNQIHITNLNFPTSVTLNNTSNSKRAIESDLQHTTQKVKIFKNTAPILIDNTPANLVLDGPKKKLITVNMSQCRVLTADEQNQMIKTLFVTDAVRDSGTEIKSIDSSLKRSLKNPLESLPKSHNIFDRNEDIHSVAYNNLINRIKTKFVPKIGNGCTRLMIDAINSTKNRHNLIVQLLANIETFETLSQQKHRIDVATNTELINKSTHCQTLDTPCIDLSKNQAEIFEQEFLKMTIYKDWLNYETFDDHGNLPIHTAVLNNDAAALYRQCVVYSEKNRSVDIPNTAGMTPLHLSVATNKILTEILLKFKANPQFQNFDGDTTVHLAVKNSSVDLLQLLITTDPNIDLNTHNFNGHTPLIISAINGDYKTALVLLDNKANPNVSDRKSGRTPLFFAIENHPNNEEFVRELLKRGADPLIKTYSDQGLLELAKESSASAAIVTELNRLIKKLKRSQKKS